MFQDREVWLMIPAKRINIGCPGKNRLTLAGRPIIDYTLDLAYSCKYIDRVFLVTDDSELAAATPVRNVCIAPESFHRTPSTLSVCEAVRALLDHDAMPEPGIILEAYASTPVRPASTFVRLIEGLARSDVDCSCLIVPVKDHPNWHVSVDMDGIITSARVCVPRQEFKPVWRMSSAGWAIRWSLLRSGKDIYEGRRLGIPAGGLVVDIDDESDKFLAESLLRRKCE